MTAAQPVPASTWREPYTPYDELPFIVHDDRGAIVSWWAPPKVMDVGGSKSAYEAEWSIGRGFAADLIQVLKECRGYTDCDGLMAVVEEMVKPRELTYIEKGFLWAISEYLAADRIQVTSCMDAAFTSEPTPYREPDEGQESGTSP